MSPQTEIAAWPYDVEMEKIFLYNHVNYAWVFVTGVKYAYKPS